MKRGNGMDGRYLHEVKKICIFFIVANLPFLTVVHLMGIDIFLESFQHPDTYQCIKTNEEGNDTTTGGYFLLETPAYQGFIIQNGDIILYRTGDGSVRCEPVFCVELHQGTTIYYTTTLAEDDIKGPIYGTQVLGKVTGTIDDNLWNALSLQIWDFSIKNLNAITNFGKT
jgi:hypothetical protein